MADVIATILLGLFVSASAPEPGRMQRLQAGEPLRVMTRENAATYFEGPDGPLGFEVELTQRFAASIGVRIEYIVADGPGEVLRRATRGEADIAAAGLTVTSRRAASLRIGPTYQQIVEQIVYRQGEQTPGSVAQLADCDLEVAAESSHVDTLERLRWNHPFLRWRESAGVDADEVLENVAEQRNGCTIADSNEVTLARRFFPELAVAFDIGEPRDLAWMFPQYGDDELYMAVARFFSDLRASDELTAIIEAHYGNAGRFDYVSARRLHRHTALRLPPLLPLFKAAGAEVGIDWRLLAAIGYQESHWNPQAVSPTGVRGVMMLTAATADQLGIDDRVDPRESIFGGARYLRLVKAKIPSRIPEPDRTWFALAAYNIGYGHLEDARVLTQSTGGDPGSWDDVREHLPLLADPDWHPRTKHGFARGGQPVHYVDNVRHYHEILLWLDERGLGRQQAQTSAAQAVNLESGL